MPVTPHVFAHVTPLPGSLHPVSSTEAAASATRSWTNPSTNADVPAFTSPFKTWASLSLPVHQTVAACQLNLSSTSANILLGADILRRNESVTIDIGGQQKTFTQGSYVTAAEYVAIKQTLGKGQTLDVDNQGTADGGTFSLSSQLLPHLADIVIPQGVTALDYLSSSKNLSFSGDIFNYGSIYAVSTNANAVSGTLSAKDIINESGGVISSLLPQGQTALPLSSASDLLHVNLTLDASNSLSNSGAIASSGNLTITSGPSSAHSLSITNTSGIISAPAGQVTFTSSGAVTIDGGNVTGKTVSFQTPNSALNVQADAISGQVSVKAATSNVQVASGDLSLQSVKVKNDPIFVNASGDVFLPTTITNSGGPVTVIAAQEIVGAAGGTVIDTSTKGAVDAGSVTLLAGTASTTVGGITTATGPSGLPGEITGITSINATTSGSGSGGAVTVASYGGIINIGSIDTSTKTGMAGQVSIFAPGGIKTGDISTRGDHLATAYIDVESAAPNLGGGIKYDSSGNLLQGAISVGTAGGGSITTGNLDAGNETNDGYRGGDINIIAGGSITTGSVRSMGGGSPGGGVALLGYNYGYPGGAGGNISITANGGAVIVNGDINTSGGGGGGSNIGVGGAGGNGGNISVNASGTITVNGPVLSPGGGGGGGSGISSEDTPGGGGSLGNGGGPDSGALFYSPPPYEGPGYETFGLSIGNPNHVPFPYPGEGGSNTAYDIGCCGGGYGGNVGAYGNNGTSGTFQRGTFDDETASAGGAPGLGGNINISGAAVAITQTIASYYGAKATLSPYAGYSVFAYSALGNGQINLSASGSHVSSNIYATDGDLTTSSQNATITINPNAVVIAGKTLGDTVVLNGSGTTNSLAGGSFFAAGTPQLQITENGSSKVLTSGEMITPAELIAAIQISNLGVQSLTLGTSGQAVSGAFSLAAQNLPSGGFSTLVVPANVNALVTAPTITVTGNTVIGGVVQLQNSSQLTTASLQLNNNASINTNVSAVNFSVTTPVLTLGASSSIAVSGNITIVAPAAGGPSNGLQIFVPNGSGATINTSASQNGAVGQITIDGNSQPLSITNSSGGSLSILALSGGPVTLNGADVTISSSANLSVNYPLTLTSSTGQITNDGVITAVSPTGGGGTVTFQAPGALTIVLGTLNLAASAAGGGSGGNLNLLAPGGQLTVNSGAIDLNASGSSSFVGGHLFVNADGFVVGGGGALNISANGSMAGAGGQISINDLANQNLTITNGGITISATGGSVGSQSGDGGTVTIVTGGNLAVDMAAISAGPLGTSGAGAIITLSAGTSGSGLLSVSGNIDVSGVGTGSGGQISLLSNSASAFVVSGVANNGVNGVITANAGANGATGGTITLQNLGSGGVTVANSADISAQAAAAGGAGGILTISAANGTATLASGDYNFGGSGSSGAGGQISIIAQSLVTTGTAQLVLNAAGAGSGNGGVVNIALSNQNNALVFAQANDPAATAGTINIEAQSGSQGGAGGHVSIATSGLAALDASAIDFNALGANGAGGSLAITASTFTNTAGGTLVLDASGHGTGNGGVLSMTLTAQNSLSLSSTGDLQLVASGGSASGSGGTAAVKTNGTIDLSNDGSGLIVGPGSANGNGGNIILSAVDVEAIPGGPGGNATGPLVINASGYGSGNGGSISLTLSGTGTQSIGLSSGQIKLVATSGLLGGNGGAVAVTQTGGVLALDPAAIVVAPQGKNGSGGNISLSFDSITWDNISGSALVLNASGKGTGNGGTIVINQSGQTAITIGKLAGQFNVAATAGKGGGNGGSISISGGGDLTVQPAGLTVLAIGSNGNGGNISLAAGTAGSGNLLVSGSLSAIGTGKGNGGQISLSSSSTSDFVVGGSIKLIQNGIAGTLSTRGKVAGTIAVSNDDAGIEIKAAVTAFDNMTLTDGGSGSILLSASLGSTAAKSIIINQNGSGNVLSQHSSAALIAQAVSIKSSGPTGTGIVGGIVAGVHGQPATDSGILAINTSALSLGAATSVNVKDSSKTLTLAQQGNTTGSFTLSDIGQILISDSLNIAGTLILNAGSSGSINSSGQSSQLNAANIVLNAGRLGIGTANQSLLINTGSLQVGGSGPEYLLNNSAGVLAIGASNVTGTLNLNTLGDVDITGLVGSTRAIINIAAGGNGNIYSTGSGFIRASLLGLNAQGGSIGSSGGPAGSGPLATQLKTISALALGTINISNVAPATSWENISGSSVSLVSSNAASIVSVASTNGNVQISANAGRLSTVADARIVAIGGSISLSANAKSGTIAIGAGSQIETSTAAAQSGNITISLGNESPQTFTGKLPTMLSLTTSGTGSIFLGAKGIGVSGSVSNLSANNQTINLNTDGRTAGSITLGGGTNIIAGILDTNLQASTVTLGQGLSKSIDSDLTSGGKDFLAPVSASIEAQIFSDLDFGLPNMRFISSLIDSDLIPARDKPLKLPAVGRRNEKPLSAGISCNVRGHGKRAVRQISIAKGRYIFAPAASLVVDTPHGALVIDAGSLVLVDLSEKSIGIFDFDDTRPNAVVFRYQDSQIALRPGGHLLITSANKISFEELNSTQLLGFRNIREERGVGTKFEAEFDLLQAIYMVENIRHLTAVHNAAAREVSNHLLKTAAIMHNINAGRAAFRAAACRTMISQSEK